MSAVTDIDPDLASRHVPPERIPVIDLAPLLVGGDTQTTAERIMAACRDLGFFYIQNHGVPERLRADFFAQAARFFALPLDAKLAVDVRGSHGHRGYFPVHAENNDPDASLDLKEGFDVMAEQPASHPGVQAGLPFHGANRWPAGLPGFEPTVIAYFDAMTALASRLMNAIAAALALPDGYFDDKLGVASGAPLAMLRMLHYPPQSGRITRAEIGTGAHTDYGLLTILAQDDHGGLQVRTPDGGWIDAPPLPETYVVNIGDELQRWSNDRLNSTPHRVINVSGADRYSAPFFFHAAYDTVIDCLPGCLDDGRAPKYPPITAGDYMWQRFEATFAHHKVDG